ncbi:twin-arginine translocase TatA/TatE family subunit [Paenibacillus sp. SI8]|uniref:twin-arginine translocase TatA/TatE family subunit n=1 Tax=unclassified Paenibacillus TaxID=185978 RepID=UPI003465FCA5
MFQNIGFTEILLIAIVALILFGPQKLPEIGRTLGRTIQEFKKGTRELLSETPLAEPAAETPAETPAASQNTAAPEDELSSAASEPAPASATRRLPD